MQSRGHEANKHLCCELHLENDVFGELTAAIVSHQTVKLEPQLYKCKEINSANNLKEDLALPMRTAALADT